MPNNILFWINFISSKTLNKKIYILFFRILVIKVIGPIRWMLWPRSPLHMNLHL